MPKRKIFPSPSTPKKYLLNGIIPNTFLSGPFTKNNFLESLNSPYVITAYAKGLPESKILFKHVLRNAINPLITIFGYELSGILSGAALVEIITNWPGMGRLILEAVLSQDIYLVMASLLIGGILLILGNLFADIMIAFADPRVRLR